MASDTLLGRLENPLLRGKVGPLRREAAAEIRRLRALLAQERGPDAWMRASDAERFRTGGPHYGSNAPMFTTIADDMRPDAVPVYFGTPPTEREPDAVSVIMKHWRQVKRSPGVGEEKQQYAFAVLEDILLDLGTHPDNFGTPPTEAP